jgi:hypothetical protein
MNNYIKIAILLVVAAAVVILIPKKDRTDDNDGQVTEVNDFLSCSHAGYTILETYPAQCRTPDGQVFVEDINEPTEVVLTTPTWGQLVTSPLTVSGKARGPWFFEANLPVSLRDMSGNEIARVGAQATDNWMTEDFVNFTAVLEFKQPTTEFGTLVIQNDNPSGDPKFEKSYAIPVRFK